MPKRLRGFIPPILGLVGGTIALYFGYATFSQSNPGCSCDWFAFQLGFGGPPLIGGLAGLAGAGVYFAARGLGGVFMITGGIMNSILVYTVIEIFLLFRRFNQAGAALLWELLGIGLVASPSILMVAGGLLSFQKIRRIFQNLTWYAEDPHFWQRAQ